MAADFLHELWLFPPSSMMTSVDSLSQFSLLGPSNPGRAGCLTGLPLFGGAILTSPAPPRLSH